MKAKYDLSNLAATTRNSQTTHVQNLSLKCTATRLLHAMGTSSSRVFLSTIHIHSPIILSTIDQRKACLNVPVRNAKSILRHERWACSIETPMPQILETAEQTDDLSTQYVDRYVILNANCFQPVWIRINIYQAHIECPGGFVT